jgi:hypothetical protein
MGERLDSKRTTNDGFTAERRRAQSLARVRRTRRRTATMGRLKNSDASRDFRDSAAVAFSLLPMPPLPPLSRQITRHTMPSNFQANLLKINDGGMHEVSHFFMVAFIEPMLNSVLGATEKCETFPPTALRKSTRKGAARANLLSFREAPKMTRLMTSFLDKRNFFEPSALCWAFVFRKGSQVDGKSSLGDQERRIHG